MTEHLTPLTVQAGQATTVCGHLGLLRAAQRVWERIARGAGAGHVRLSHHHGLPGHNLLMDESHFPQLNVLFLHIISSA